MRLSWLSLSGRLLTLLGLTTLAVAAQAASGPPIDTNGPVILYATHFEASEGFVLDQPLAGQNGWVQEGSGGSGLVSDFFPGGGQQAYLGASPPAAKDEFVNVWRPVNQAPVTASQPLIKFSVLMQIYPSTNGHTDDFRWGHV